jgi:hypothetical protein
LPLPNHRRHREIGRGLLWGQYRLQHQLGISVDLGPGVRRSNRRAG